MVLSRFSTIFAACLAAIASTNIAAETIQEAVDATLKQNPEVLAEANRRYSVDKTVDQAKAGYYPRVDLTLGIGYERTKNPATRPDHESLNRGEAEIKATQMLYDGFATKSAVEQSQAQADAAGYDVTDMAETIGLNTVQSYLDVLKRQQLLEETQESLEQHEKIFDKIKLRTEAGVGNRSDLDQTTGRAALAQANLRSTEGNLQDAKTRYQRLVGHAPESLTDPGKSCCDTAPAAVEDALQIAYRQHPSLWAAMAQHEASLAQEEGAKAPFHPQVNAELSTRADNNLDGTRGHEKEAQAMIRMDYNLLNGGADKARIEETKYLSEQAKQNAEIIKRNVDRDVRLAWINVETLSRRLPILEQRKIAAEKTRDAYFEQFNVGRRTLLDLLDTENELLTARNDYTNAYYDHIYACYWLSETMGRLMESLSVEAPEAAIVVAQPETTESPQ
ncbi:MAG: TolC family outer membrane protein [Pseudomonadota bacterium]|uniref:TolC family outer membrane protein n=1 Tax=Methylophaga aminisulfidivorans TaxID=230105 RepID=UPI0024E26FA4|nr:TolC family outer membrane protein [Methylophaga aminisulfidivorans]MEC9412303.1 TolC family outer membrane protein [Pseudomonadota bacterium]